MLVGAMEVVEITDTERIEEESEMGKENGKGNLQRKESRGQGGGEGRANPRKVGGINRVGCWKAEGGEETLTKMLLSLAPYKTWRLKKAPISSRPRFSFTV